MIIRYVLRGFARRKTRAAMGILGVFCTLALLTAVHVGLESVAVSYVDLVSLSAGKADVIVSREGSHWFAPIAFDAEDVGKRVAANPHLRGVSPRLMGIVQVSGTYALVVGIDPAKEKQLEIDGFVPWPALGPGKCALSESLAHRITGNVSIGGRTLTSAGRIERQQVFPQQVRDFIVTDIATAREVLGEAKGVHALAGAFREPKRYYDARDLRKSVLAIKDAGEAIAEELGSEYSVKLPKADAITAFELVGGPLRAVFGVFALVALAITALLLYSLITVSAEERIREHSVLRVLGAKQRHIFGMVLLESGVLCLMGVVPGVLCGLLCARLILAVVGLAMGAAAGAISLEFSGATMRFCLGAGALVSIASAVVPALRAMRWRIVDGLDPMRRGQIVAPTGETAVHRPLVLSGAALSAISGTVFFILPTAFMSGDPSMIGAVVLGLLVVMLIGFTMVAVGAQPLVERGVLAVCGWMFGAAAEFAGRNLVRHRRRNAATSLMFALSVSFVLFLASLVALFSRQSMEFIERRIGSDLRITMGNTRDRGLDEALEALSGVKSSARAVHLRGRTEEGVAFDVIASDIVGMKHLWVVPYGVDPSLEEAMYAGQTQWEEGDASALRKLAEDPGLPESLAAGAREPVPPAVLSLAMARALDVHRGDLVQLQFHLAGARRSVRVRVEGVSGSLPGFHNFRSRAAAAMGSGLLLSARTFEHVTSEAPPEAFEGFCLVKADGRPVDLAKDVRDKLGLRYRLGVECAAEEKTEAAVLYWVTQVLFAMLLGVAVTIAVFGLVASMATAVIERRWEVGVLKAIGLRRGHLYRMFAAEAVTLTVSSGAVGGAMGFLLAYLFVAQAGVMMETPVVFTLPWITFAATFAVCGLAGLVASWLPTRRMIKKPVAEILRG